MKCLICEMNDVDFESDPICEDCNIEYEKQKGERFCFNCKKKASEIYLDCEKCENTYYFCTNEKCFEELEKMVLDKSHTCKCKSKHKKHRYKTD